MSGISMRYIVNDVPAAVAFYSEKLGFEVEMQPAPGFAALSKSGVRLLLNQPGAGGAGQNSAGDTPSPGGWNRIQIEVENLAETAKALKHGGCQLPRRNRARPRRQAASAIRSLGQSRRIVRAGAADPE